MNKDLEILRFIAKHLQQNQRVVLMVVVSSLGSSPGRPGFKMAVAEDGELFGSIGGGIMEVNLVEIAKEFISLTDEEAIDTFGHEFIFTTYQDHRKDRPNSSGMICNGKQWIMFFKIHPSDIDKLELVRDSLNKNHKGFLTIGKNGIEIFSSCDIEDFDKIWSTAEPFYFIQKEKALGYREKLGYKNQLYIIGGGHCALALSELMSKFDFHISLFDDRPNLNTLERNRFAHSIKIIKSYEQIAEFVPFGTDIYVVVMTLGYKFDEIVIRQLFEKDFKYFGVLGSKSKMRTLLKTIEKDGFDKNKLSKIHTPIGLPINSHTPEEIAVSIAAEIIAVKNS